MDILGQMIALMLLDPVLCVGQTINSVFTPGLLPNGPYLGKEQPDELPAPPAVLMEDSQTAQWLTFTSRIEKHTVKAVCYAAQGATAGQKNPVVALADAVERLADWFDLNVPTAQVLGAKRTKRDIGESGKRSREDLPVYVAHLEWEVNLWVGP